MIAATERAPSRKIVVYEPDKRKRALLGLVLVTHGYVVECAANEAHAHSLCESLLPDLVLIGLSNPVSSSFEVYDRFRRRHSESRVEFIPGEFTLCDLSLNGRRISSDEATDLVHEIENMFTDEAEAPQSARTY